MITSQQSLDMETMFKETTLCHVYYVEGLGHNLFLVGQFCDGDLEVAFRSDTCYVWNLEGENLITGSCDSNIYTISISKMVASSLVCLMSKATSTKSWLWHRRLSHLNFGTIKHLTKQDLVDGLSKFKYDKDHLCPPREKGMSKKAILKPKLIPITHSKLELIHMDLCGRMRVKSINGKRYIMVIIDDYSRYTCTPSSSLIIIEEHEAPQVVSSLEEPIVNELTAVVSNDNADESFKDKFMGTVRFGHDHFAAITGYRDYVQGNHTICHVYYVEGLGHNLFLVGQFCDGDLEVAFRSDTCYVWNLEGENLLTALASECNNSGPGLNCSNFQDSS
nr:retrovirus-related Pol polyprotein from transposon TNT 1-94 [Tanacetum cinerariifolium]